MIQANDPSQQETKTKIPSGHPPEQAHPYPVSPMQAEGLARLTGEELL